MAFTTGTLINHYKVVSLLGAGGMGEVYKAHDTRLDRAVALKILPADLVADPDRVRRFIQEAKSASALNHPHIVAIYEIGQVAASEITVSEQSSDKESTQPASSNGAGSIHYIAMEFVEGETLHAKIHRERVELKKSLEYLAQVADGLAKAHAAGIVHRDLKPENIMISEDGYAKILDFGLAKLVEIKEAAPASGDSLEEAATAMMNQTRPGMVMGTVGYMSPEQVQGKAVDQRSDIFSFGCILYEAATRIKPFSGDSMIDSLHKIVYAQAPPIKDANPNAPAELQRIVRKCLAKSPDKRYQSIKEVAIDLRELIREYDSQPLVSGMYQQPTPSGAYPESQPTMAQSQPSITGPQSGANVTGAQASLATDSGQVAVVAPKGREMRWVTYGAALAVIAIVALTMLYFFVIQKKGKDQTADQKKARQASRFQNPKLTKLTNSGRALGAVISPDGKYVAHIVNEDGQQSLWVRHVATSGNEVKIPRADVVYKGVSFSRDSNYIYYVSAEKGNNIFTLYRVEVFGGSPKKVIEDVDSAVTFSPDGKRMAFVRGYLQEKESALIVTNADGTGEQQKLVVHKRPNDFLEADWSPDGDVIACSARSFTGGFHFELIEVQVADGTEKTIGSTRWGIITGLAWLPDAGGLVISGREQSIGGIQLQLWQVAYPNGEARKLTNDLVNYAGVSVSAETGALVTLQTDAVSNVWILPGSDAGRAQQITLGSGKNVVGCWTPDGKIVYLSDASGNFDIWIMDADGKNQKQLTSDPAIDTLPAVSPDGRYIVFCSNRGSNAGSFNLWRMNIDGSNAKQLTTGGIDFWPVFTGDGQWVIYNHLSGAERSVLWKVPVEGGEPAKLTEYFSMQARISPDGKSIACLHIPDQANPKMKLAIIPADGGQPTKMFDISPAIGESVNFRWTADGKAITYLDSRSGIPNLWVQPISGGEPKQLTAFKSDQMFSFDWSRDGKHLACSRGVETTDAILIRDEAKP